MVEKQQQEKKAPAAIIVGAGVAGMTVAHELAERGYEVHVIEREVDVEAPDLPDTGGAARTQWWHPPTLTTDPTGQTDARRQWLPKRQVFVLYEEPITGGDGKLDYSIFDDPRLVPHLQRALNLLAVSRNASLSGAAASDTHTATQAHERDRPNPKKACRRFHRPRRGWPLLQVWHDDAVAAHRWWEQVNADSKVIKQLRGACERNLSGDGQKIFRHILETKPKGYGYSSIELEAHSPDRARLVLVIDDERRLENPANPPDEYTTAVGPRTALPGEHGYRFFPSFYANVFHTMERIPVLRSAQREVRTPTDDVFDVYRTVFDNLRSVERHSFAFPDGRGPITMDRRRVRSLQGAMKLWRIFQQKLGFSLRDILLYEVCLLRFLTSGESRRKDAELVSWNEYVDAGRFSPAFREALGSWSLALGGLRGDEADARTFGAIALQFVLDQVEERKVVDGTLNGPTSQAWFQPWRRFLARRGLPGTVTFHSAEVNRLCIADDEVRVGCEGELGYRTKEDERKNNDPQTTPADQAGDDREHRNDQSNVYGGEPDKKPVLPPNATLILATQPHEAYRLLRNLDAQEPKFDASRVKGFFRLLGKPTDPFIPSHLTKGEPPGPLRHFIGVQFFQSATTAIAEGHIYLPKSAWGLTAIGQSQFRASREAPRRGVISVDVGAAWRRKVGDTFETADESAPTTATGEQRAYWQSTREMGVKTIWETLREASAGGAVDLPTHAPVHTIDRGIIWGQPGKGGKARPGWLDITADSDASSWQKAWLWDQPEPIEPNDLPLYDNNPYLITTAGRFDERPGQIDRARKMRGYDPIDRNLFLAGAYTQTFTRIVTMESACESGRHVVNGILRKLKEEQKDAPERCRIHDPEDLEPEDLKYWKELDDRLHAAGLPHLLDILHVESWLEELLPTEDDEDTGDTATLVDRFDRLVDVFEPDGEGVTRLIQWAGAKSFGLLGIALRILGR